MKVIKKPAEFKPVPVICKSCDAELLADDLQDFTHVVGGDQRDYWDYLAVTCPFCKRETSLHKEKVPKHLLEQLKTRES